MMTRQQEVTTAVVAAAGSATRMWPASKAIPKELFPVGRIPAILHLVAEFAAAGIKRVILVVAPKYLDLFRSFFDRSLSPPPRLSDDPIARGFDQILACLEITLLPQLGSYGNATPLITAAGHVGAAPCVYAFGDDIVFGENVTGGLLSIYALRNRSVMAAQEVDDSKRSSFGIIEGYLDDGTFLVTRLIEKPTATQTTSNLAAFGRYIVTPDLLNTLLHVPPGRDGEIWFVDGIIQQIREGKEICAFPLTKGKWYTVGDPDSYTRAVVAAAASPPSSFAVPL